jgi:CheY-like chemotaxis protein
VKNESLSDPAANDTQARAAWMVVDDNEGALEFLAAVLESIGIAEVHRFQTGHEALSALTAAPARFQFVITDLEMPVMNGIELCRRMHAVSPELKIVLATGSAVVNEPGARQCGFCGLLAKPFPAAALWRIARSAGVFPPFSANPDNN